MQKISQPLPEVALTVKREIEISKTVFAIKDFFAKHFDDKIYFDLDLRDFSRAAVSVSPEHLALLLRFLLDKCRPGKRVSVSVREDEFALSFSVERDKLEPMTSEDEKRLAELARTAGFKLLSEHRITLESEIVAPMQYLVFVRSRLIINNVLEIAFGDLIC